MSKAYRVLITGSRTWTDKGAILAALREHANKITGVVVVHGACPEGADKLADELCQEYLVKAERHPAAWHEHSPHCPPSHAGRVTCKSAGFRRNKEMVDLGADVCLAFIKDGSRGATHCADAAERAGIPTYRFTKES